MKKWMLITLLFPALYTTGQPGFNKTYSFEQEQITGSTFANVLMDNDTMVLFGTCYPPVTPPGQQALLFVKMDTLGSVLLHKCHLDPDAPLDEYAANSNFDLIKTSDNGYALTGGALSTNFGVFVKLSHGGEIEFYKKYDPSPSLQYQPRKIFEIGNGYLLGGHKTLQNGDIQVFLMKVDKQGNFLWEKTYGQPGVVDVMGSLVRIDDNHFAIGAAKSKGLGEPPYNANDTWSKGWLIQVDSLGNIISAQEGPANTRAGMNGLKRMPDGWLFAAVEFQILNLYEWGARSKIVRTGDDIGDVKWERYVSTTTLAGNTMIDIKPTPDGNWVAVGQWATPITMPPEFGPNYLGGATFKFTSGGDSLWARLDTAFWHPTCGSTNYLGGGAVLSSGSIVAAGYADIYCLPPTPRSYGWVLKISKDGCIDTLCITTDINTPQQNEDVKIFPNPTTGIVNINGCEYCKVEVFDLLGKLMHRQVKLNNPVDFSFLPDGVYLMKISDEKRLLTIGKIIKCR
jgi:hypothetical protein